MATARKTAKRNVPARARRATKTTLRDAKRSGTRYAKAAVRGVKRAANAVAEKVTDVANAAKRNPRKAAVATGVAAAAVVGIVRARRRRH
jgi:hypothetical protein